MTELEVGIDGRENGLLTRLTVFDPLSADSVTSTCEGNGHPDVGLVAIVGLGYVGLPTVLTLVSNGVGVTGVDSSPARLAAIAVGEVDLSAADAAQLKELQAGEQLSLTGDTSVLAGADAIVICVPTPVDERHAPERSALQQACATVVKYAHAGQTIILSSTCAVGATRELLVEPLRRRGLEAGVDVAVACSPERIDPGNPLHERTSTPRVVGGATRVCGERAARVIQAMTTSVHLVSSLEAAELTKLYENTFRAVVLSLANEFADACGSLGLDPAEVTLAAATKPYGFLATFPGPGVGGHCIPCDPYYLLARLARDGTPAPLISQAMRSIEARPARVVARAGEVLAAAGRTMHGARLLVVGASYKPNVADLRNSSAVPLLAGLRAAGAKVGYHDPMIRRLALPDGTMLDCHPAPRGEDWDLVIVHTVHEGRDYSWVGDCSLVLDATYRFEGAEHSEFV